MKLTKEAYRSTRGTLASHYDLFSLAGTYLSLSQLIKYDQFSQKVKIREGRRGLATRFGTDRSRYTEPDVRLALKDWKL